MTARFRAWLEETHGAKFELVRHFLLRFFDNDMVSIPGEWQKVAIGVFAALISFALPAFSFYWTRYRLLHGASFEIYRQGVRDDLISFIAMGMALIALLTILQWQSLFPSLRDMLALAGLPIRPREIFAAKFASLLLVFVVFVLSLTVLPSVLFSILTNMRQHENPQAWISMTANFAAFAGSCVFVFFTLLAIQGILLQVLSAHTFSRVSIVVQAVLFILTVSAAPLVGSQPTEAMWWPPVWFVRLWESIVTARPELAKPPIYAMTVPAVLSIAAYLLSYHRYRRMLLESQAQPSSARWAALGARILERLLPDPREQAAFSFIGTTLFRSRSHRLLLLSYAGVALGWTAKGLVESPPVNLRDEGLYGLTVVLAPIAMAALITLGLRYLFALPVMLRANWVFQAVEAEDRPAWHLAIEKFIVWAGIVPVFVAGLPAAIAVLGPLRGSAAMVMAFLAALIFFERYFRQWRKLPFTCSYLPGQQAVWLIIFRIFLASGVLLPVASLFLWASAETTSFIAVATGLGALWYRWHKLRRREWAASVMLWEHLPPPAVEALNLDRAKTAEAPLSVGPLRPERNFGDQLVASRGILPAAWNEEIEAERESHAFFETLWEDVRYGARLIRRNPLLSAIVVLTLTVGIGINASVFTVMDGAMLQPHVGGDAASFVRIFAQSQQDSRMRPVSYSEYKAFGERNRSVRSLAAFRQIAVLLGDDDSVGTSGLMVSCNFFLVEGLDRASLGRLIDANDCRTPGQAPVALISERVWRTRFGADPKIVGRTARLNNRSVPIVGVVPDRTSFWAQPTGVWLPLTSQPYFEPERNLFQSEFLWLDLAGRMSAGYTRDQVRAEFGGLARQLDYLEPGRRTVIETTNGSWYQTFELRSTARSLFLWTFFLSAFHLVLFIACANVATLLLSRAAARRREVAVRLSLGAPRVRLVRMLVTEALLLAVAAGGISVWLLYHVPKPLFRYLSPKAPDLPFAPDWMVFAYVAVVVLVTGIASGLAPALESLNVDLTAPLKGGGGSTSGGGARLRAWLVTTQVALSMVLLVEAALFGQSENRNLNADPGYLSRHVVVAPLRFPDSIADAAALTRRERIASRVLALPGVRSVSFSGDVPMIDHYTVEVRPPNRPDAIQPVDVYSASVGFMGTLGVPLLRGRDFGPSDHGAVVISEDLQKAFFWRRNPVGSTLNLPSGPATIIGVARGIAPLRFGASDNPAIWLNAKPDAKHAFLSVRFATPELARGGPVRGAIHEVDPNLVVVARNLQGWIDMVTEEMWNMVTLIVILGIVATVLATTGIYGAVSYAVNQRMRDLGIRVALGASRPRIIRDVLMMGGKPVLRGLLVGSWLSVAMAASLRENLKGSPLRIDSSDPLIYIAAMLLLATAAVVAMFGPARRGSNSDPLDALRCE
jgi:predicted permease